MTTSIKAQTHRDTQRGEARRWRAGVLWAVISIASMALGADHLGKGDATNTDAAGDWTDHAEAVKAMAHAMPIYGAGDSIRPGQRLYGGQDRKHV